MRYLLYVVACAVIVSCSSNSGKQTASDPVPTPKIEFLPDSVTKNKLATPVYPVAVSGAIEEPWYDKTEAYNKHFAYSFVYDEKYEQSKWVAYNLKEVELQKNFKRSDRFKADKKVRSATATNADYRKSGYDKGHLAPAADMTWNETAMQESFYFSNISPQLPQFNRGIWKELEEHVRGWAKQYDSVYVVTGPIFKNPTKTIGENNVTVPTHFFKALLVFNKKHQESIAFLFPHEKGTREIAGYAVTVDSLESFSGLNCFHLLPDDQENMVEREFDISFWKQQ